MGRRGEENGGREKKRGLVNKWKELQCIYREREPNRDHQYEG